MWLVKRGMQDEPLPTDGEEVEVCSNADKNGDTGCKQSYN